MIFQNLLKELEIHKTTHGSRHFFASELIRYFGSDLATVARFTRHSNLETLQIYDDEMIDEAKSKELAIVFSHSLYTDKEDI